MGKQFFKRMKREKESILPLLALSVFRLCGSPTSMNSRRKHLSSLRFLFVFVFSDGFFFYFCFSLRRFTPFGPISSILRNGTCPLSCNEYLMSVSVRQVTHLMSASVFEETHSISASVYQETHLMSASVRTSIIWCV